MQLHRNTETELYNNIVSGSQTTFTQAFRETHVCVYVCVYVCMYMYVYECMHTFMYVDIRRYLYI